MGYPVRAWNGVEEVQGVGIYIQRHFFGRTLVARKQDMKTFTSLLGLQQAGDGENISQGLVSNS